MPSRALNDLVLTTAIILIIGLVSILYSLPNFFTLISLTNKQLNPAVLIKNFFTAIFTFQRSGCIEESSYIFPLYEKDYNSLYIEYKNKKLILYLYSCPLSFFNLITPFYEIKYQGKYIGFAKLIDKRYLDTHCNLKIPIKIFEGKVYVENILPFDYYSYDLDQLSNFEKTNLIYSTFNKDYLIYVSACKKYYIKKIIERYTKKDYRNIIFLYFYIIKEK